MQITRPVARPPKSGKGGSVCTSSRRYEGNDYFSVLICLASNYFWLHDFNWSFVRIGIACHDSQLFHLVGLQAVKKISASVATNVPNEPTGG
jgi:hypothetical protein